MRRHRTTEARLAALPLIGTATAKDRRDLAAAGDVVTLAEGGVLHAAGERPRSCALVLEGVVALRQGDRTVAAEGAGAFVGLVEALDGEPAVTDAVAAGTVTLLVVAAPRLRGLLERNHVVRVSAFRQLAQRTRALDELLAS